MAINKSPKVITRKLGKHKAFGLYWESETKPLIELDARLKPKKALDTLLHESLHHLFPDMPERVVTDKAKKLMHILWQQNYRKTIQ